MDQSVEGPVPKGLIVSAQRALRVMEVVAQAGDGITAKAIARRADLKLSTAYQLINTLVHDGYLVRLTNAHGFGLGYKLFGLQCQADPELFALHSISKVLRDLHPAAAAPLYFTVFRDAEIVIADVADSERFPRAKEVNVGFHQAPQATAYGKLILAGVAFEAEEFQPGLTCLAVPVIDHTGHVRGAVAASSPTTTFLPRRAEIEDVVRIAAARVTRILSVPL